MNLIHRQVDSLDVPNAPIDPAAPRPERAPTWLWLVAIVAVCLFGATLVVLLYPFVQALLREFDAALVEYAGVIRLALVGAVVLVILIAVWRLYHWAAAGAYLRLENQHPMHRQDLRAHVAPAVPSLLGRHYDVLEAEAGNPTRNVVTYGPHSSWSYRYDTNETGAPPIEALPEQPAPALPAFEAGRPVLQQLYDRGHVVRSGSSLLVGFAEGGVPQYIEMPGCGFVFVGGQPRSGKTTLVKLLVAQAILHDWHVLVCDPHIHKDSGLLKQLQPLSGRLVRQDVTPAEIAHTIGLVDKIGQRRKSGQDRPDRPVLLVIDEFSNLVIRKELDEPTLALLPAMAMAYAGVQVHGVIIGHDWSRAMLGGTYGATLRRAGTHRLVTRIAPDAAELLLPSAAHARQAADLTPGRALFWGDESPIPIDVPFVGAEDLAYAARGAPERPYTPRQLSGPAAMAQPALPAQPVPPTVKITEPTIPEQIVFFLQAHPGTEFDSTTIARRLSLDSAAVQTALGRLAQDRTIARRGRARNYLYSI